MRSTEELIQVYVSQLMELRLAAMEAGMDEQDYLNEHPEALPIVGDGNQTEVLWTENPDEVGNLMFFVDGHKWEVTKISYADVPELLEKRFSDEVKEFKWAPYWAYVANEILANLLQFGGGCGCGCDHDHDSCDCGHDHGEETKAEGCGNAKAALWPPGVVEEG
jgi:hypothetical protein